MKERKIIETGKAPAAIGPYSQAVAAGDMVYTSGQLGIDPATGKMAEGGAVAEVRQALKNLTEIIEAAGSSMENIVKTLVFVTDLADFAEINKVYTEFFSVNPPARSLIQVAALPLGGRFEIEAVAIRKSDG